MQDGQGETEGSHARRLAPQLQPAPAPIRHRALDPHAPAGPKGLLQGIQRELDGGGVEGALGLTDDQLAADQLEPLAGPEHPLVDQALILGPAPPARPVGA